MIEDDASGIRSTRDGEAKGYTVLVGKNAEMMM
jgi:hypothetical protein